MNKIAYLLNWGANVGAETAPILGGYCGGPAGTAIASTAYIMIGILAFKGSYQLHFPVHFKYGCSTTRDVLWVVSTSCQAASRNIPMPVIWLPYIAGGPNTKMYFHEAAAWLLAATASGAPSVQTPPLGQGGQDRRLHAHGVPVRRRHGQGGGQVRPQTGQRVGQDAPGEVRIPD